MLVFNVTSIQQMLSGLVVSVVYWTTWVVGSSKVRVVLSYISIFFLSN